MSSAEISLNNLPEDSASLKAMLRDLLVVQEREQRRAAELQQRVKQQTKRADELHLENLRLQMELARYRKWTYGPRADRLSEGELLQALLQFGEELAQKPLHPGDARLAKSGPEYELRRVKRRLGRRNLASFENLPVTMQIYELSAEQRACPCCGEERKEIGAEQSWQIEYIPGHFERIEHVRKKYACAKCEAAASGPQIEGGQAGNGHREGPGGAGTAGVHREQQVRRLPAVVPAGSAVRAAGF